MAFDLANVAGWTCYWRPGVHECKSYVDVS